MLIHKFYSVCPIYDSFGPYILNPIIKLVVTLSCFIFYPFINQRIYRLNKQLIQVCYLIRYFSHVFRIDHITALCIYTTSYFHCVSRPCVLTQRLDDDKM